MLRRIIGMASRAGAGRRRPGGPAGGMGGPRPGPGAGTGRRGPGAGGGSNAEIQRGVRSVVKGLSRRRRGL